jgi:hypothetical protein
MTNAFPTLSAAELEAISAKFWAKVPKRAGR